MASDQLVSPSEPLKVTPWPFLQDVVFYAVGFGVHNHEKKERLDYHLCIEATSVWSDLLCKLQDFIPVI